MDKNNNLPGKIKLYLLSTDLIFGNYKDSCQTVNEINDFNNENKELLLSIKEILGEDYKKREENQDFRSC